MVGIKQAIRVAIDSSRPKLRQRDGSTQRTEKDTEIPVNENEMAGQHDVWGPDVQGDKGHAMCRKRYRNSGKRRGDGRTAQRGGLGRKNCRRPRGTGIAGGER